MSTTSSSLAKHHGNKIWTMGDNICSLRDRKESILQETPTKKALYQIRFLPSTGCNNCSMIFSRLPYCERSFVDCSFGLLTWFEASAESALEADWFSENI